MVPRLRRSGRSLRRLPRSRGDGPVPRDRGGRPGRAPPLTRGWSRRWGGGGDRATGSPAHAGMVPWRAMRSLRCLRLPRSRGDGPFDGLDSSDSSLAPPLTRGWSLHGRQDGDHELGSPAHAGMVHTGASWSSFSTGLPRSRGDGPNTQSGRQTLSMAPPLTRGWSLASPEARTRALGSPAHAGMVPRSPMPSAPARRLPRSRGDGPYVRSGSGYVRLAPPLTRGWSRRGCPEEARADGSPAHAGMVPSRSIAGSTVSWLPRSRGDGPLSAFSGIST